MKTKIITFKTRASIMRIKQIFILFIILLQGCKQSKTIDQDIIKDTFSEEQTDYGLPLWNYIRSNTYTLNTLNQNDFTNTIDSLQSIFTTHLNSYKNKLDKATYKHEEIGIQLAFSKLVLEYPELHELFTGKTISLSHNNQSKLKDNLIFFNDETLLTSNDLKRYVLAYIEIKSNQLLKQSKFSKVDNQELHANWEVIEFLFTNTIVKDFWKQEYLYDHIDNLGIKNIDEFYSNFMSTCNTTDYKERIANVYNSHKKDREAHSIETYKEIDDFNLEMHLFLPKPEDFKGQRPTIVQFHGGSWSKGKPDWFFSTAEAYAKEGWVVAVVDYRIKGKQGTYPFEAVKDAKSAIRWLREHAKKYNINPNKIIATGNSAGGHLSLATVLIENWNESTDNLKTDAKPNVVIVNSGVYDLTGNENRWITENYKNKAIVKEISPNHLLKKSATKMLLIHGDNDRNCPYESAQYFYTEMKALGNTIELHTIKDAEHLIWYGKHAPEVTKVTNAYIKTLNFN